MSHLDAARWNERYLTQARSITDQPRDFLIEQAHHLPARGLALDAAMGLGANAAFLIERGLDVIGVDVSEVAARQARARQPRLMAAVIDLDRARWPDRAFDVILNFYFLSRPLFSQYRHLLRPGGVLIGESLLQETVIYRPDFNPDFLLAPGELRALCAGLDILVYREGWINRAGRHPRAVASVVARRTNR